MARRVSFSGKQLGLLEIAEHHDDLQSSLRLYFSDRSPNFELRFVGYSNAEVLDELGERVNEIDLSSSLALLASVEAAFRIDYLQRCYRRSKDAVSRTFREIYRVKQSQASLDEDIFQTWLDNSTVPRQMISDLRGAFRFRHWLAHGRYWTPKLGRKYSFIDLFALAQQIDQAFPFYEIEP